ncbi:CDP-alcohol phosphatidyltransferase family protein [Sphingomonas sp. 1P08PE]|uniref:CDP-alcohol phosphatidyltransferase family protein n=1 Tax=Sphingomonas sp. 1P08PE TaxID=554122 RepID=UPI0039A0886D
MLALAEARVRRPGHSLVFPASASLRLLDRAGRQILAATGKAGDGIVSRHINRPVSRAISQQLLRVPGIRPFHASVGTALLGLAMVSALLFGGNAGMIAGALLFQAASIFDGVDGEMARATFRTSKEGASLDSVIDAGTNLAFITGVTVNVGLAGDLVGAAAGTASLLTLALGLTLLGRRARNTGQAVNFDVVKTQLRKGGARSTLTECLIHLTMRDFYAAACAILIVAGLTHLVLLAFATVTAGWFCVTIAALTRSSTRRGHRIRGGADLSDLRGSPVDRVYGEGGAMLALAPESRRV